MAHSSKEWEDLNFTERERPTINLKSSVPTASLHWPTRKRSSLVRFAELQRYRQALKSLWCGRCLYLSFGDVICRTLNETILAWCSCRRQCLSGFMLHLKTSCSLVVQQTNKRFERQHEMPKRCPSTLSCYKSFSKGTTSTRHASKISKKLECSRTRTPPSDAAASPFYVEVRWIGV